MIPKRLARFFSSLIRALFLKIASLIALATFMPGKLIIVDSSLSSPTASLTALPIEDAPDLDAAVTFPSSLDASSER